MENTTVHCAANHRAVWNNIHCGLPYLLDHRHKLSQACSLLMQMHEHKLEHIPYTSYSQKNIYINTNAPKQDQQNNVTLYKHGNAVSNKLTSAPGHSTTRGLRQRALLSMVTRCSLESGTPGGTISRLQQPVDTRTKSSPRHKAF